MALAANGQVKLIAQDLDVSLARMYELLGKDNPYSKQWRILAAIARRNPDGLRLLRADFNSRCDALLCELSTPVTTAEMHRELSEVIQADLARKPAEVQRKEILQAVSILCKRMSELDTADTASKASAAAKGLS